MKLSTLQHHEANHNLGSKALDSLFDADETGKNAILALAETVNDYYLFRAAKRAVVCAILNNLLRSHFTDTGQRNQLLGRCGIEVHAFSLRFRLRF